MDPIRELKIRADILHARLAKAPDPATLARLRVLPGARVEDIQKKHCLTVVARESGFTGWEHARRVLEGDPDEHDLGTLLWIGGFTNHWFASYDEARAVQRDLDATERHYLLGYKRHFLVVNAHFIEALGMNPEDADWNAIGWDWARPKDVAARGRLFFQRLDAIRRAAAPQRLAT